MKIKKHQKGTSIMCIGAMIFWGTFLAFFVGVAGEGFKTANGTVATLVLIAIMVIAPFGGLIMSYCIDYEQKK